MALEKFVNAYVARTPRSREIYEDARKVLPGGVSGNAKFLKPYPLYVKRARGSHVIDVDGMTTSICSTRSARPSWATATSR